MRILPDTFRRSVMNTVCVNFTYVLPVIYIRKKEGRRMLAALVINSAYTNLIAVVPGNL